MSSLRRPEGLSPEQQAIADEVDRIHESALWSGQGEFEQMKLWRLANVVFGVPAAALAAIAGGTGLAAQQKTAVPAILALIAAAFGAALTTLNPSRRVTQAQAAGNSYMALQTAARQLLTIDLVTLPYDEAREELRQLTVRRDEINRAADPPSRFAYWWAKRNIGEGGQKYEADN
jgi:hypothetical protein